MSTRSNRRRPVHHRPVAESAPGATATLEVSDTAWNEFSQADYDIDQWHRACLIHRHDGDPAAKSECSLPVREPGGEVNRNGVHAAAARINQVRGVSAAEKKTAARALVALYRNQLDEEPPEALVSLAGEDDEAADAGGRRPGRQAVTEAASVTTDGPGRLTIQLIKAGWSLNGNYYPAEVLMRDGPRAWPAGTLNFVDHPTDSEDLERPAGSLQVLASYLTEAARWDDQRQALVAPVRLFAPWREAVTDWAASGVTGMSIRAWVDGELGSRGGQHGYIVSSIVEGRSVDYVTTPAAGGQILEVLEHVRPGHRRALVEARNVGAWLEARMHLAFTELADSMYGDGRLTRGERLTLSAATGDALTAWTARVEGDAPQLFQRDLFDEPGGTIVQPAEEAPTEDVRRALGVAGADRFGGEDVWVWVRDFDPDAAVAWFERSTRDGDTATLQVGYAMTDAGTATLSGEPVEVTVQTTYTPKTPAQQQPPDADEEAAAGENAGVAPDTNTTEENLVDTTQETAAVREADEARRKAEALVATLTTERDTARQEAETARAETVTARTDADTAKRELARYRAAEAARPIAATAITESGLPKATQAGLLDAALRDVPLLGESLTFDETTFRGRLTEAVTAKRAEYEAWEAERKATDEANGAGTVRGLGGFSGPGATTTVDTTVTEGLIAQYKARGMSDDAARLAAAGRPI